MVMRTLSQRRWAACRRPEVAVFMRGPGGLECVVLGPGWGDSQCQPAAANPGHGLFDLVAFSPRNGLLATGMGESVPVHVRLWRWFQCELRV